MKRLYTSIIFLAVMLAHLGAQVVTERCFHLDKVQFLEHKQDFWRSHKLFSTMARGYSGITGGLYNVTEAQYGFGLKEVDYPYAQHFAGATTVFGWRFSNGLAAGAGAGFLKYNEGYLVPLIGDVRYFMGRQKNKFFVMGAGGFMLNFDDLDDYARFFGNPGVGITIPLARSASLSFSVGLLTQWVMKKESIAHHPRDSFINMRLGLLFGN